MKLLGIALFFSLLGILLVSNVNAVPQEITVSKLNSAKYNNFSKKIDQRILDIVTSKDPKNTSISLGVPFKDGKVAVYIYLNQNFTEKIPKGIGVTGGSGNVLVSRIQLDKINQLANLDEVEKITPPAMAKSFADESEGVAFSSADIVHQRGFTGSGANIAIIDLGFDVTDPQISSNITYSTLIDSGDICGGSIACGDSPGFSHGNAVAENIVDMAPDASLLLYTIANSEDFLAAVDDATSNDAKIISLSIGFPTLGSDGVTDDYRDGTSVVANKVNEARDNGVLVTAAIGNSGKKHWMGTYTPSSTVTPTDLGLAAYFENVLEFQPSASGFQKACLPITNTGDTITVTWNDWLDTTNDYDIFFFDSSLGAVSGISGMDQTSGEPPIEILSSPDMNPGCLVIASYSSSEDNLFHVDVGDNTLNQEFQIRGTSLSTPADATGALTVGAINQETDSFEYTGSSGPTDDARNKPEICGPDNVSTHQDQSSGLNPFFGTSSSTAHVAGAAALLLEEHPGMTVDELRQEIVDEARNNPSYSIPNICGSGALNLIPPLVFTASRTDVNTIILTFPESVDTDTTDGSGFALSSGTVTANSDPGGLSNIMTLTTSGLLDSFSTPTVTYEAASGSTVGEAGYEIIDGFNTIATDGISPSFTAARTSSTTWVLTFSENVDSSNANENSSWSISGGQVVTSVSDPNNSSTITITAQASSGTAGGQLITYDSSNGTLSDSGGNELPNGANSVASDQAKPTFTAARTGQNQISLTFSEPVSSSSVNGLGYSVSGGTVIANTDPSGTNIMLLTTSGISGTSATPTISYSSAAGTTIDQQANEIENGFSSIASDNVPPTFTAFRSSSTTWVLSFSENVDALAANENSAWMISGGNTIISVTDPANTNHLTITSSSSGGSNSSETIIYVAANGTVTDSFGNEIANGTSTVAAITCSVPSTGDWIISSSCVLTGSKTAPASVIVQNNSILTIQSGATLNIDFVHYKLLVKQGSGVLVKTGGKIT